MGEIEELAVRARQGDKEAFTALITPLQQQLYRIAWSYMGNEQDSLDMVQSTIEKIYINLDKLREPQYFRTWAIRILINQCKAQLKKQQRSTILETEQQVEDDSSHVINRLDINQALNKLGPQNREALILRYIKDYSLKEIAEITGCPLGTVKSRIHHGLAQLRRNMDGGEHCEV